MTIPAIENYKKIKSSIPVLIEKSGLRDGYIADKIGVNQANFSVKKQRSSWKDDEIEKILSVITEPSEDVEDFLFGLTIESLKADDTVSFEEFKSIAKWK